jgi:hypothetical protein
MLTNEVSVNIYLLAFILGLSVFAGFAFRARMILKARAKMKSLKGKFLITTKSLELNAKPEYKSKIQDIKSPVITMKSPGNEVQLHPKNQYRSS